MHAKYLSPQFAARGETGLRDAEHQLNFFTHPQNVTKHGKAAAVLVPIRQWDALQTAGKRALKQVLLDPAAPTGIAVPARGSLKLRRV